MRVSSKILILTTLLLLGCNRRSALFEEHGNDSNSGTVTLNPAPTPPVTSSTCPTGVKTNTRIDNSTTTTYPIQASLPSTYSFCQTEEVALEDTSSIDPDNDGWGSACELAAGTDPCDADSDDDGIVDGADHNPLDANIPFTSSYLKDCNLDNPVEIVLEIPAPAVCNSKRDATNTNDCKIRNISANTRFGDKFNSAAIYPSGNGKPAIKYRLKVPTNFNGTVVNFETDYQSKIFGAGIDGTHGFIQHPFAYPPIQPDRDFSSYLSAGYAVLFKVLETGDIIGPALNEFDNGVYRIADEWVARILKESSCSQFKNIIATGQGARSWSLVERADMSHNLTPLTSYDGIYLDNPMLLGYVPFLDYLAFINFMARESSTLWTYGTINNPPGGNNPLSVSQFLYPFWSQSQRALFFRMLSHPSHVSSREEIQDFLEYSFEYLTAAVARYGVVAKIGPSSGSFTVYDQTAFLGDGGSLTDLNNLNSASRPSFDQTKRDQLLDIFPSAKGTPQVPILVDYGNANRFFPSVTASVFKDRLSASHRLNFSYKCSDLYASTDNKWMPVFDTVPEIYELSSLNELKTWIETGLQPADENSTCPRNGFNWPTEFPF